MDEFDTLFEITEQYGKKAAVMETGFSTYIIVILLSPPLPPIVIIRTEEMQKEFINTALPTIREKVQINGEDLIFVAWYELVDEKNPDVPLPQEYYFGILRADLSPKLGYNDLKQQFNEWIW